MGYDFAENSDKNIDREKYEANYEKIDWTASKKKCKHCKGKGFVDTGKDLVNQPEPCPKCVRDNGN